MWNPIAIAFFVIFYGFLVAYPLMQAFTLVWGRGAVRWVSVACAVFGLPFYVWMLTRSFGPQSSGDLSGVLIFFVGPWFLLVQLLLTGLVLAGRRRESTISGARNPGVSGASE